MSISIHPVAASEDDWDSASDSHELIVAKSLFLDPPISWEAFTAYDLSFLNPTETVYDFKLNVYTNRTAKSRTQPLFLQAFWWLNPLSLMYDLFDVIVIAGLPPTGWTTTGWQGGTVGGWPTAAVNTFKYTVGSALLGAPGDFFIWEMRSFDYAGTEFTPYMELRHGYSEDTAKVTIVGA